MNYVGVTLLFLVLAQQYVSDIMIVLLKFKLIVCRMVVH